MISKQTCHLAASRNLPYKTAGSWASSSSFRPSYCRKHEYEDWTPSHHHGLWQERLPLQKMTEQWAGRNLEDEILSRFCWQKPWPSYLWPCMCVRTTKLTEATFSLGLSFSLPDPHCFIGLLTFGLLPYCLVDNNLYLFYPGRVEFSINLQPKTSQVIHGVRRPHHRLTTNYLIALEPWGMPCIDGCPWMNVVSERWCPARDITAQW